jgi:hypothetical protein
VRNGWVRRTAGSRAEQDAGHVHAPADLKRKIVFKANDRITVLAYFRILDSGWRDAAELMVTMVRTYDTPTLEVLGVVLRPVRESIADSLRWLAQEGHLSPVKVGRPAGRVTP